MASGWNLWVWLQCIGVVSGCCCKEIGFLIILLIPTPYFLQLHPYFFVQFKGRVSWKIYYFLIILLLCQ